MRLFIGHTGITAGIQRFTAANDAFYLTQLFMSFSPFAFIFRNRAAFII